MMRTIANIVGLVVIIMMVLVVPHPSMIVYTMAVIMVGWIIASDSDLCNSERWKMEVARWKKVDAERRERELQEMERKHQEHEERRRRIIVENPECVVCLETKGERQTEWCLECGRGTCLECHATFAFTTGQFQDCPACRERRDMVTKAEHNILEMRKWMPRTRDVSFEIVYLYALGLAEVEE